MSVSSRVALAQVLLLLPLVAAGCGGADRPELGSVTGNVTMDGQPLPGVIILFKPEVGRPATATTDSEGNYELVYRHGVKGTKIGPNTVSFEWPLGKAGAPIPQKYSPGNSSLTKEVQPGDNVFNIALKSN